MKLKKTLCLFLLVLWIVTPVYSQYQPGRDGWAFINFGMTKDVDKLWELYGRAFLGVANTYDSAAPDDQLFFNLAIKACAGKGDCFGMSMLSNIVYQEGGHLGICGPAMQYEGGPQIPSGPDLQVLRDAIAIMHMRQMAQPLVNKLIQIVNDARWNDPVYAWNSVKHSLASGDLPVLSFVPSSIQGIDSMSKGKEAHTVVPYKAEKHGLNYRIYVYDPNFPYEVKKDFYDGPNCNNYIEIEASGLHNWKFPANYKKTDKYGWQGSSTGPWTIFTISCSDAKYKSKHPLSHGYLRSKIGAILFSGTGSISQIQDDTGRQFYSSSTAKIEFEKNPARKTDNIMRWPFFTTGDQDTIPELYFLRNIADRSYKIEIQPAENSYRCQFLQNGNVVTLDVAKGKSGRDIVEVKSVGTKNQTLQITSERTLKNVTVQLVRRLRDSDTTRTFSISDMSLKKDSPLKLKLVNNMNSLQLLSEKAAVGCDLEISQTVRGKVHKMPARHIKAEKGKVRILRPENWQSLEQSTLESNSEN
ncbi:hypothetical protein ACFL27_22805 [candidate division CSSED10-310 bacterium]|uniref:Uncharacterized protein n=1 Tax=candidate division CSSED10-310 bacterium TaxID=2855610 RepID=A0ABV6Z3M3_UNCC1